MVVLLQTLSFPLGLHYKHLSPHHREGNPQKSNAQLRLTPTRSPYKSKHDALLTSPISQHRVDLSEEERSRKTADRLRHVVVGEIPIDQPRRRDLPVNPMKRRRLGKEHSRRWWRISLLRSCCSTRRRGHTAD